MAFHRSNIASGRTWLTKVFLSIGSVGMDFIDVGECAIIPKIHW